MEIVDNRIVLFRTKNPDKYKLIPKHKIVGQPHPGIYEVAVNWGLQETRVLRNLGVRDVPSPIQGRYSWPGRFQPFKHQIQTASFLTMNQRAYCFNEPGCVDADTEYLSPTGWKRIADYAGGPVAQYHPDTGSAEFVEPKEFVKLPCESMIRVRTKYGLDQLLSPEHRMLVHSNAADKWCVMQAADVLEAHNDMQAGIKRPNLRKAGSDTVGFGHAAIPTVFSLPDGAGVALSDAQLRVQVAVIADGHFGNATNRCVVRLKRERKVLRMRNLLQEAGIEFSERKQDTPTAQGFTVFTFLAPMRVKEFGAEFWAATAAQRSIIAEEIIHWDGTDRGGNKGPSFSSTSKASADFVQFVWNATGRTARISEDRRDSYKNGICYTVQARGTTSKYGLLSLRCRTDSSMWTEPSVDGFKYCFMVPSTFLLFRRNGCVFASGNTGKTLSCLWAADYLMLSGFVRRALVVCPLSIMDSAWLNDAMNSIIHRRTAIAYGSSMERRRDVVRGGAQIVICNYDGVQGISEEIIEDDTFDLVILDEANYVKNASTVRWKALNKIVTPNTWVWSLTGTPAPQSPVDAYGLAKITTPSTVPRNVTLWKDKVMHRVTQFKWVPKREAPALVHAALQPAIRFTKDMCLDLPPVLTSYRLAPLTTQQRLFYDKLKKNAILKASGEVVTAANAATVVNKLLQISAGAVYTDEKETLEFDCSTRLSVLSDIIQETERKLIIFANFRSSIDTISIFLREEKIEHGCITGDVTPNDRSKLFDKFQNDAGFKVLIIQPQSAAHGVTLTAASSVVFWGPVMSVETYIQCIARADRIGQKADNVTVYHIYGSDIEKKMFDVLERRVSEHNAIVDIYNAAMAA